MEQPLIPASLAPEPPPAEALAALTARVAELERQLAALQVSWPGQPATHAPAAISSAGQTAPAVLPAVAPLPGQSSVPGPPRRPFPPPPMLGPPVAAVAGVPARPAETRSLEKRIGGQIFNRIAIVALLIGVASFLKLAIDQGWLGPVARLLIGLVAGAALVLWSERFRRSGSAVFSYSLKAVGTGVLYLSLWAAYQLYHLMPGGVALLAMIGVAAWNAFMAWQQDAELLAGYALAGALGTPLLLSTGTNDEPFLFTYLLALNMATVVLLRLKPWPRIALSALAGTVAFYFGWYARYYVSLFGISKHPPLGETMAFLLGFFALFAVPSLRGFTVWRPDEEANLTGSRSPVLLDVLLPLGDAVFASFAVCTLLVASGHRPLLAWVVAGFAAAYLGLMRLARTAVSAAVHLAAAVVFLTVAIPLKATGHFLTIAWLVEGLALLWASTRATAAAAEPEPRGRFTAAGVLHVLAAASFALGLGKLVLDYLSLLNRAVAPFFSSELGSALVAVGAFAGAAYLGSVEFRASGANEHPPVANQAPSPQIPLAALFGLLITAVLLSMREAVANGAPHTPFANPDFASALLGLLVLALTVALALRLPAPAERGPLVPLAGTAVILFNLLAILSFEREIGAFWTGASLGRSLAISGFLMVYGAALLALGFVRRLPFIRWQALVLIVFTIGKVFLFDVSGLSEGYRVASFLGLGALLLGVSFAYQKDWLSLRDPAAPHDPEEVTHAPEERTAP